MSPPVSSKRIGIDARALIPGKTGIGVYLSEILNEWLAKDDRARFELFSPRPIDYPRQERVAHHVAEVRYGLPWYLFRSHRSINLIRPDAYWGVQSLLPMRLSHRISAILTIHDCVHLLGTKFAPSRLYNWLHRLFLPASIGRAERILADSNFVAKQIVEGYHVPREKIAVIPLGVSQAFIQAGRAETRDPSRLEKYGIHKPYLLGVGSLEPRKNLKTLLRAWRELPEPVRSRYQLVLAGKPGWRLKELQEELKRTWQTGSVLLTGYVPAGDLPLLYAQAELFVFPSFYEGFGLPVLEAMASGCPVVASNSSSLPEVIGEAAMTLAPDQPPGDWARALSTALSEDSWRRSMRERGLKQAALYPWERCARETALAMEGLRTINRLEKAETSR
jgi:alpha-1,3-rhamnosyl/mannosyltransferase